MVAAFFEIMAGFVHVGIYIPHMFGIGALKSSRESCAFFGYLSSMSVLLLPVPVGRNNYLK